MTEAEQKARKRRNRFIALVVGMLLALVCKSLPPDYRTACDAIVSLCTSGSL